MRTAWQTYPTAGAIALLLILLTTSCTEGPLEENYDSGPNGEPPKALEQRHVYRQQFTAEQKNYVLALGTVHAFLKSNDFLPRYLACFHDVLNIRITAPPEARRERFPCVVLKAEKGAPTKIYLRVIVDDVFFNQLDRNNRLLYTVEIYGRDDLVPEFSSSVVPRLTALYGDR